MNSIAWQGPWTRATNTCIICLSVFWMTEERSMWIMNCFVHRLQRSPLSNLLTSTTIEPKKAFGDLEPVTVIHGWQKVNAPAERRAHGLHHILQRREVFAADVNSGRALEQVPEQVQVSVALAHDFHRFDQVQDPENHNHHQWLNIRQSVQPKALHHPEEKTVGCAAII